MEGEAVTEEGEEAMGRAEVAMEGGDAATPRPDPSAWGGEAAEKGAGTGGTESSLATSPSASPTASPAATPVASPSLSTPEPVEAAPERPTSSAAPRIRAGAGVGPAAAAEAAGGAQRGIPTFGELSSSLSTPTGSSEPASHSASTPPASAPASASASASSASSASSRSSAGPPRVRFAPVDEELKSRRLLRLEQGRRYTVQYAVPEAHYVPPAADALPASEDAHVAPLARHPEHHGRAVPRLPYSQRTPWVSCPMASVRPADVCEVEHLLGDACKPSVNRLRRRIGLLPPLRRVPPPTSLEPAHDEAPWSGTEADRRGHGAHTPFVPATRSADRPASGLRSALRNDSASTATSARMEPDRPASPTDADASDRDGERSAPSRRAEASGDAGVSAHVSPLGKRTSASTGPQAASGRVQLPPSSRPASPPLYGIARSPSPPLTARSRQFGGPLARSPSPVGGRRAASPVDPRLLPTTSPARRGIVPTRRNAAVGANAGEPSPTDASGNASTVVTAGRQSSPLPCSSAAVATAATAAASPPAPISACNEPSSAPAHSGAPFPAASSAPFRADRLVAPASLLEASSAPLAPKAFSTAQRSARRGAASPVESLADLEPTLPVAAAHITASPARVPRLRELAIPPEASLSPAPKRPLPLSSARANARELLAAACRAALESPDDSDDEDDEDAEDANSSEDSEPCSPAASLSSLSDSVAVSAGFA